LPESQSLLKSGLLELTGKRSKLQAPIMSQSLLKSGLLEHSLSIKDMLGLITVAIPSEVRSFGTKIESGYIRIERDCRNPFWSQVFWNRQRLCRILKKLSGRNPFWSQVFWNRKIWS